MNKGFQYNMATGRATLPAAVIVSMALWAANFNDYYQIACIIVCIACTYLLIGLDSAFGIIKTKSYIAPAMFAFTYTAYSFLYDCHDTSSIIPLLFIGSTFFIIRGYDSVTPILDVFYSFLCAGISCIIDHHLLFAVPVLFTCMIRLRSMNIRGIISAIFGFSIPFGLIAGYFIAIERTEELKALAGMFFSFERPAFDQTNIITWVCIGVIFLIFISSAIPAEKISIKDKVKNRCIIKSLNITGFYIFAFIILVPQANITVLPVVMLITSIIFGYVTTRLYNKITLAQMILSILMVGGIAVYGIIL